MATCERYRNYVGIIFVTAFYGNGTGYITIAKIIIKTIVKTRIEYIAIFFFLCI